MILITAEPVDVQQVITAASSEDCGALAIFLGTVRNHSRGREVYRLEYDAYAEMAVREIEKIIGEAKERWDIRRAALSHRTGALSVGDIAVAIAVATPHRRDSFDACRYIIDRLKETVPIWKKEFAIDGETWIDDRP